MTLVAVNYEGGRYDQALERVNKVLKADPDNVKVRYFRGQILLRKPQPDIEGAINDLTEVNKRDPNNIGTRLLLADAFRKQGDTPRAVRQLEEGLRLQPLSRELRMKLMDFRWEDGTEVLRLAREARENVQLKDDPVWAYREAGAYSRQRNWKAALAAIQDAIKLAPGDLDLRREQQNILLAADDYKGVMELTEPRVAAAQGKD